MGIDTHYTMCVLRKKPRPQQIVAKMPVTDGTAHPLQLRNYRTIVLFDVNKMAS